MDFQEITVSWFLSWGADQRVVLADRGLCHVEGSNEDDDTTDSVGSGKSSLFEAIVWALYGKTIKKRSHADAVVHTRRPRRASTSVTLKVRADGVDYTISRYRKSPTYKNKLFLYAGAKDISHLDPKETQAVIDKLVGMDHQTFINSIFFGQGMVARFAALEPSEKHQVLERVLDLGDYGRAAKIASAKAVEAGRDAAELGREVARLREDVSAARKQFRVSKRAAAKWSSEHAAEVAALTKRLDGLLPRKAVTFDLSAAKEAARRAKQLRAGVQERRAVQRAAIERIQAEAQQLRGVVRKLKQEQKLKLNTRCAVCRTKITKRTQAKHAAYLKAEQRRVERDLSAVEARLNAAVSDLTLLVAGDLAAADLSVEAAEVQLAEVMEQHAAAEADKRVAEEVRKLRANLATAKNPHPKIVKAALKTLRRLKRALTRTEKRLKKAQQRAQDFSFWVAGFGAKGLKSLRLDTAIPTLNKFANKYIAILSDDNIKIEISTTDTLRNGDRTQRLNVSATNRWGGSAYEDQSGGEGLKVDVALALGMQALAASRSKHKINIALFDEPTIYLDATGQEAFMKVLIEEAKTKASVFVCTHDDALKGYFPATVAVKKKGGITTVA